MTQVSAVIQKHTVMGPVGPRMNEEDMGLDRPLHHCYHCISHCFSPSSIVHFERSGVSYLAVRPGNHMASSYSSDTGDECFKFMYKIYIHYIYLFA
jgi:hypothetical protein